MKGFPVGSIWWWRRVDGYYTEVVVTRSLKTRVHLHAGISGCRWSPRQTSRLKPMMSRDARPGRSA